MPQKNYYELLEISETASVEIITAAYKTQMKKYHPDIFQGDKAFAEEYAKELNQAYSMLSDPEQRKAYDLKLCQLRKEDQPSAHAKQTAKPYSQNLIIAGYCEECGCAIKMTQQKLGKMRRPPCFCRRCYQERNQIEYRDYCVDCGDEITLTRAQVEQYMEKGWDLPTHCKRCRELRKLAREEYTDRASLYRQPPVQHGQDPSNTTAKSGFQITFKPGDKENNKSFFKKLETVLGAAGIASAIDAIDDFLGPH